MRIQAMFSTGLVCTAALATVPTAHAQDWEAVEITTRQVAPGVYMLMGRGGNLGVSVGDDGVFLIDDQYAPLTDKIVAAIRSISDQPIRFVINTHWHGDHTGGNENLGKAGTLIVAHDNVRRRMSVDQFIAGLDMQVAASPEAALPVVTFSETVTFHLNGDELYVFHVEHAHTDGDAVIHFRESNVLHAGDIYFAGGYPFIDVSSGGSIDGTIAAIDQVLALVDDETPIIPGHGELSNKAELTEYRAMLAGVRDAVAAEIAKGSSVEDVVAAQPTAAWDEQWGSAWMNPEQFTRILYSDLSNIEY